MLQIQVQCGKAVH